MTALPPLPPPAAEGTAMHPTLRICYTAKVNYTPEQVEAIRRETVEACARIVEAQTQRGRRLYAAMNAEKVAACQYAAALRALLEKQE